MFRALLLEKDAEGAAHQAYAQLHAKAAALKQAEKKRSA